MELNQKSDAGAKRENYFLAGKLTLGSRVTPVLESRLRDFSIMAADTTSPTRPDDDGSPELELQAYMRRETGKSAGVLPLICFRGGLGL